MLTANPIKAFSQTAPSQTREVEWRAFDMEVVRKWLRRTHVAVYALGIATVLFVQHYGKDPAAQAHTVATAPAAAIVSTTTTAPKG